MVETGAKPRGLLIVLHAAFCMLSRFSSEYSFPHVSPYFIVMVSSDAIHPYDGLYGGQLDRIQNNLGVKPLGMSDWEFLLSMEWFDLGLRHFMAWRSWTE